EGDLGRVDGVIRAIEQRRLDIHHRETERSLCQPVAYAVFHRAKIVLGHDAPVNLLVEDVARSARPWLDLHHNVAELAVAARLLLVTAALGGRALDGLAIGGLGPPRGDADPELPLEPIERDAQVHLALAGETELTRHHIGTEGKRRVLVDQPRHGSGELHIVRPVLGFDRERIDVRTHRWRRHAFALHAVGADDVAALRLVE